MPSKATSLKLFFVYYRLSWLTLWVPRVNNFNSLVFQTAALVLSTTYSYPKSAGKIKKPNLYTALESLPLCEQTPQPLQSLP